MGQARGVVEREYRLAGLLLNTQSLVVMKTEDTLEEELQSLSSVRVTDLVWTHL